MIGMVVSLLWSLFLLWLAVVVIGWTLFAIQSTWDAIVSVFQKVPPASD